jgi:O-antigen/teichoic acid export membrane protein
MATIINRVVRRVRTDDLLLHGALLSSATLIATAFLFLFNVIIARALGPEQFGIVGALFAIFAIASQFGNALQLTVSRQTSRAKAQGDFKSIGAIIVGATRFMAFAAAGVGLLMVLATPFMASFLNISAYAALVLLAVSSTFYLVLPVLRGGLQGMQQFRSLSINRAGEKIVLLIVGVVLLALGTGINGVMIALGVAGIVMIAHAAYPLRHHLKKPEVKLDWKSVAMPGAQVLVTVILISILANIDLVLAKHYLPDREAGLYSAIGRTGRVVFFVALAFNRAMFPKATEAHALGQSASFIMVRSLAYIGAFCTVCVLGSWIVAKPAMSMIYGAEYADVAYLLPWNIAAVSLLSISTVMMYYNLSISSNKHLFALVGSLVLLVATVYMNHDTALAITIDLLACLALLTVTNAGLVLFGRHQPATEGETPTPLQA